MLRCAMVVRLGVFLACAAAVAIPRAARACICAETGWNEPPEGATDVPTNTKIWRVSQEGERAGTTFRLVGPAGDVAMDDLTLPIATLQPGYAFRHVLTPKQPLTPGAKYRLLVCDPSAVCSGGEGFTVGSRRLDTAALPKEESRVPVYAVGEANTCGAAPTQLVTFRFDWSGIALLWDADGDNAFSPTTFEDLHKHSYWRWLYDHSLGLPIGSAPCLRGPADPSGYPALNPTLRFGVLDIAGNFSGWTTPQKVAIPTAPLDAGTDSAVPPDASPPGFVLYPDAAPPDAQTAKVAPRLDAASPISADAAFVPGPDGSALPEPPALADDACSCHLGGRPRTPSVTLVLALAALALRRSRRSRIDLQRPGESDR